MRKETQVCDLCGAESEDGSISQVHYCGDFRIDNSHVFCEVRIAFIKKVVGTEAWVKGYASDDGLELCYDCRSKVGDFLMGAAGASKEEGCIDLKDGGSGGSRG